MKRRCHPERSGAKRNAVEGSRETSGNRGFKETQRAPSTPLRSARDDGNRIVAVICALLIFGVCGIAAEPPKITYADHVLPILRNSCLNCHNPDKKKAGLDLSTYDAAMKGSEGGPVITPGDPGRSLLFRLISHSEEPVMPAKSGKLPDPEIALIKQWIEASAPENSGSTVVVKKAAPSLLIAASDEKPKGAPPMPRDLLLEPAVHTKKPGAITALASSPWAPLIAIGGEKQVLLYHSETLELSGVLGFPEGRPAVLKFSRDGALLLAAGGVGAKSGRAVAWDVVSGERLMEVGDEFDTVLAADMSPDRSRIALGGPAKLVKLYGTDGTILKSIKKHTDWVTAITFTADGKLFASGDRQGNLYVWEADGNELFALTGHKGAITALCSAGSALVSSSEDGTIKIWNLKEGKQAGSWEAHKGGTLSAHLTPEGNIISCGRDRVARVWDQSGKQLFACEPLADIALQAAGNAKWVIVGGWAGAVYVCGADGKKAGELMPNPPHIVDRLMAAERAISENLASYDRASKARTLAQETRQKLIAEAQARTATVLESGVRLAAAEAQAALAERQKAAVEARLAEFAQLDPKTAEDMEEGGLSIEQARWNVDAARHELDQEKTVRDELQQGSQQAASQLKAAEEALTLARNLAGQQQLQLDRARAELAKWRAAELNIAVYSARREMKATQAEYAARSADAAGVSAELERAKADAAREEKALAEAPVRIKAREEEIATAQEDVPKTAAGLEAAKNLAEARASLAATAFSFADTLQKEAGLSPDDQPLADASGKAKASADLVANSLARSKENITAAVEKTRRAEDRVVAAQAALAQAKEEEASGPARIAKLRETVAQIAERTAPARSIADAASLAAKQVFDGAKQKVDELMQRYRALRAEAEQPSEMAAK